MAGREVSGLLRVTGALLVVVVAMVVVVGA